ncbi:hypothetical protein L2E82_41495 [Cichorium intybus]|uniref:Uncharacterized protein n=1 Tax=Cichorium intybus TaxID=13427 RepID=A0ACB9AP54_CICIN|nr:hypothetical protein L2E82_41495 [Cichorium intybus]
MDSHESFEPKMWVVIGDDPGDFNLEEAVVLDERKMYIRGKRRLEFLGDAVSVNNDCYTQSAVKVELHKRILHGSQDLHRAIVNTVHDFDHLSLKSTFGWESKTSFPKVLGDLIESLAGAILVDSGYDKERVFQSIRPLLEPLVTPETLKLHPVKESHDICQKNHYEVKKISQAL